MRRCRSLTGARIETFTERTNAKLEKASGLIRWYRFERLLGRLRVEGVGRPGYAPVLLFKALLLQAWYGLSDAELEEALLDRLGATRRPCWRMRHTTPMPGVGP